MSLNIKATNIEMTDAIGDYLEKKLASLNKLIDMNSPDVMAQVELGKISQHHKSGNVFRAEINVRTHGHNFRVVSEKEDLYAAIDNLKDELAREVKQGKEKWMTNMKKGGAEAKEAMHIDTNTDTEPDVDL